MGPDAAVCVLALVARPTDDPPACAAPPSTRANPDASLATVSPVAALLAPPVPPAANSSPAPDPRARRAAPLTVLPHPANNTAITIPASFLTGPPSFGRRPSLC